MRLLVSAVDEILNGEGQQQLEAFAEIPGREIRLFPDFFEPIGEGVPVEGEPGGHRTGVEGVGAPRPEGGRQFGEVGPFSKPAEDPFGELLPFFPLN